MFRRFLRRQDPGQPFVYRPEPSGYWLDELGAQTDATQNIPGPRQNQQQLVLSIDRNHRIFALKILDASSSMRPYRSAVVQAYNDSVVSLKSNLAAQLGPQVYDLVKLGLSSFDRTAKEIHGYRPLTRVTPITLGSYNPAVDYTALYMSVRDLLDGTLQLLQASAAKGHPLSFFLDVFTDGQDNASGGIHVAEEVKILVGHIRGICAHSQHRITGFGTDAKTAGELMGFDEVNQVPLTERDMTNSIVSSGTRTSDDVTTSLTQHIPPPRR